MAAVTFPKKGDTPTQPDSYYIITENIGITVDGNPPGTVNYSDDDDYEDYKGDYEGVIDHNIEVGDYVNIRPNAHISRIFIVSKIDGMKLYIHTAFRPTEIYLLEWVDDNFWDLKKMSPDGMITNWDPYPGTHIDDDYASLAIDNDNLNISFFRLHNFTHNDFRQLLIEHAINDEADETIPFQKYKFIEYIWDQDTKHVDGENITSIIKTRSYNGAVVAFMDWLERGNDHNYEDLRWDQVNINKWNPYRFKGDINEMIKMFHLKYHDIIIESPNVEIIKFPLSLHSRVKPFRRS